MIQASVTEEMKVFNKKTSSGAFSCGKIAGTSGFDGRVTISKVTAIV